LIDWLTDYMEEMCFVPCARDCQLSSWTSWTECQTDVRCGNGVQSRSRYIIEPSLDGGRECPDTLTDGEVWHLIMCRTIRLTGYYTRYLIPVDGKVANLLPT